jgi:hypothetical protein
MSKEEARPLPCNCGGALCEGETFDCSGCGRKTPNCRGAADDMPEACDDCWGEAHKDETR